MGAIESSLLISQNLETSLDLSEQQMVDCVTQSFGCNGGWMSHVYSYLGVNGKGITSENSYPYNAVQS